MTITPQKKDEIQARRKYLLSLSLPDLKKKYQVSNRVSDTMRGSTKRDVVCRILECEYPRGVLADFYGTAA